MVAALGSMWLAAGAAADLLAGWHFNGLPAPVAGSIAAQHGSGTADLAAFGGAGLSWQTGSDLNAWTGDVAGESLGIAGTGANGKSAVFSIGTAGYSGLFMSMAVRATSTGHVNSVLEAFDGSGWVSAGGFTLTPSTWSIASFDLGSLAFLNNGVATLRLRLEGATSAQGSLRVDNARLEGSVIPAPGAWALVCGAALCGRRRRN